MGCVWFTRDGRVLYLLPWEGSTIAGTTDIRDVPSMSPKPVLDEVDFILRECNSTLSRPINHSHVRAAWAGLRPLVRDPKADPNDTKKLARDHVVDVVRGNLISICGGKWTTYRRMAEVRTHAPPPTPNPTPP
jgi:glycerol-3-phosphate dehydrogenase